MRRAHPAGAFWLGGTSAEVAQPIPPRRLQNDRDFALSAGKPDGHGFVPREEYHVGVGIRLQIVNDLFHPRRPIGPIVGPVAASARINEPAVSLRNQRNLCPHKRGEALQVVEAVMRNLHHVAMQGCLGVRCGQVILPDVIDIAKHQQVGSAERDFNNRCAVVEVLDLRGARRGQRVLVRVEHLHFHIGKTQLLPRMEPHLAASGIGALQPCAEIGKDFRLGKIGCHQPRGEIGANRFQVILIRILLQEISKTEVVAVSVREEPTGNRNFFGFFCPGDPVQEAVERGMGEGPVCGFGHHLHAVAAVDYDQAVIGGADDIQHSAVDFIAFRARSRVAVGAHIQTVLVKFGALSCVGCRVGHLGNRSAVFLIDNRNTGHCGGEIDVNPFFSARQRCVKVVFRLGTAFFQESVLHKSVDIAQVFGFVGCKYQLDPRVGFLLVCKFRHQRARGVGIGRERDPRARVGGKIGQLPAACEIVAENLLLSEVGGKGEAVCLLGRQAGDKVFDRAVKVIAVGGVDDQLVSAHANIVPSVVLPRLGDGARAFGAVCGPDKNFRSVGVHGGLRRRFIDREHPERAPQANVQFFFDIVGIPVRNVGEDDRGQLLIPEDPK